MEKYVSKIAVVTGASSGIGWSTAKFLLENKMKVVGLARRKEKVESLADEVPGSKGNLHALQVDVRNPEEVRKAFEWITANVGPLTILVNNAGIVRKESLIDGDYKMWKDIVDTNLIGPAVASREAINVMRENNVKDGHIINLNSILGHDDFNLSNLTFYIITKHGITHLTKQLRNELMNEQIPIRVTSLSPGVVATELFENSGFTKEHLQNFAAQNYLHSADIVEAIKYILSTNSTVEINELTVRAAGAKI